MMRKNSLLLVCLVVVATALSVFADVPRLIEYQGRLTDASGVPVADGDYLIRFSIYDGPGAGANQLWTSSFQQLTAQNGFISYMLGSNEALPTTVFDDSVRYLGIKIGTEPEMTERLRMVAVPYAYKARSADTVSSDLYVMTTGDTLSGNVVIDFNDDAAPEAELGGASSGGYLRLDGNAGGMVLDAGASGDDAAELPAGSITLGEFDITQMPTTETVVLNPLVQQASITRIAIDSIVVHAPSAGKIIVMATGEYYIDYDSPGTASTTGAAIVSLCIYDGPNFDCGAAEAQTYFQDADNTTNSNVTENFVILREFVFEEPGSETVYLTLRSQVSGYDAFIWQNPTVQVTFFPDTGVNILDH